MRYYSWKTELIRLVALVLFFLLFGLFTGTGLWLALLALFGYGLWCIHNLHQVSQWLSRNDAGEPPELPGLWGQVLDHLYHMQRDDRALRARLQAMIDHLRASFASMSDATVMLDPAGNIEWSNKAAHSLLGLRQPDDSGRLLVNLIRNPDFIRYFESEVYDAPLDMASPVDSAIRLSVSVTFFGRRNRLLFARDVTRTHRLEQIRKDFVANVSHELRTPLTVISGYVDAIEARLADEPRWGRAVEQMRQQSQRMQTLINDLTVLSRLESLPRPRDVEPISLMPLMEMLREEIAAAAGGERDVHIECEEELRLVGSASELRSAFSNLAVNAAKYTREDDRIDLRWYSEGDTACFQVADTGIGIAREHIPRLTERFYRVDASRSTATGGTGLGLAIVKHVLLRHRARLRIESEPDIGSTFTCVFPLSETVRDER